MREIGLRQATVLAARRPFWRPAVLLLLGLATMGAVFYLGDTSEAVAEHIYFALGLTGMALLSLVGQVMVTVGLVLLWRWWRREA